MKKVTFMAICIAILVTAVSCSPTAETVSVEPFESISVEVLATAPSNAEVTTPSPTSSVASTEPTKNGNDIYAEFVGTTKAEGITVAACDHSEAIELFVQAYATMLTNLPDDNPFRLVEVRLVEYQYLGYDALDDIKDHYFTPNIACMAENPENLNYYVGGANDFGPYPDEAYEGWLVMLGRLILTENGDGTFTCKSFGGGGMDNISHPAD